MGREVVVAVTNGRLDGFAQLAEISGPWERIFQGQVERLARESRRPAEETGAGQDHWGVGVLRAILRVMDCGSVCHNQEMVCATETEAERLAPSPGLNCGLELGESIQVG
jgi:hypothetical protein